MRIDITSMFFNSKIEGKTATPAWGTSIGQSSTRQCRIETGKAGVTDLVIGMTYKIKTDTTNLDISAGSSQKEVLMFSVFNNIYINGIKLKDSQYTLLLTKETSSSHAGRLIINYAPYIKYNKIDNNQCISQMGTALGCSSDGCWFVYDINIKNQDELHFSAIILDANKPKIYYGTSQDRSHEWNQLVEAKNNIKAKKTPKQQIFYGCPGCGKSYTIKNKELSNVSRENIFRTIFHPDSDYSSFVGSYKPTMENEVIKYRFVPQTFTNAYIRAWQNPQEPVYLVIEEINRGNCAQIFGDLFQLLDRKDGVSEYPVKADTDLRNYLEEILDADNEGIANDELKLPANLNILATMNTSDQSLFPMDSAFKRRWEWKYIPIDYKNGISSKFEIEIGTQKYLWVDFLREVNKNILDITGSEDKQMGDFFIKSDIDEETFVNKVMFYLWSEVCKDEYHGRSFFRNGDKEFSFSDLGYEGDDRTTLLQGFMDTLLKGKNTGEETEDTENNEA